MLTPILIAIAAVVALFIVIIATRPSTFRVTRSANIAVPAATVFALVNDLHRWEAWSPWARIDPAAKTAYDGPAAGPGAYFAWSGNAKIGEGRMTITESRPGELVRLRLEFVKPFRATNNAEFTFELSGGQTRVTWAMTGRNNFVAKAVGLFINCDKMIGGEFEKGLANLGSVAIVEREKSVT